MQFNPPMMKAKLEQRYKRFLADITLQSGEVVTAHCANPGSMMGMNAPGSDIWVSEANNPKRKLKYDWHLINVNGPMVGVNTSLPNKLAEEAIHAGRIAELSGYETLKREVKYGDKSRIDFLLTGGGNPDCYVEVKSVTLSRTAGLAEFPDSKTARGLKHLAELSKIAQSGMRAVMLYIVQRDDCDKVTIASDIDPAYEEGLKTAIANGVDVIAYQCHLSPDEISINDTIDFLAPTLTNGI